MKLDKNKSDILVFLVVLVFGIVFGLLIKDLPYFSFKKELSLGEITNFIFVLFVTIYLNAKISNKRIEKDILIEDCNKLDIDLCELRQLIESVFIKHKATEMEANKIILSTRNISNKLYLLIENVSPYKNKTEIKKITTDLTTNQRLFWEDITLNLKDKKPIITNDTYIRNEKNLNEYSRNISKLRININNT